MLGKQAGKVVFHRAKGQLLNKCMCLCIIKHFLNPKKEKKKNIQGAIYCRPGGVSVRTAQDGDGGGGQVYARHIERAWFKPKTKRYIES